jgi:hypothetical protein
MKKYLVLLILCLAAVYLAGCKKHHTAPEVPPPSWSVDTSGQYPATMTAVVAPPQDMDPYVTASDEMGAFVGTDCRGIGRMITINHENMFFIMIHGKASEQSMISFQYYRSWDKHLYKTGPILNFAADGNFGTADAPEILYLVPSN